MERQPEDGARFSPRPTKVRDFCCVRGCFSRAWMEPTVRFHKFPKPNEGFVDVVNKNGIVERVNRQKAWVTALKINKEVTTVMRVCSLHFRRNDYLLPDTPSSRRYLKKSAIPMCNLPQEPGSTDKRTGPRNLASPYECESGEEEDAEIANLSARNSRVPVIGVEQIRRPSFVETGTTTTEDRGSLTLGDCIKTDKELFIQTGIESIAILDRIVKIVHSGSPELSNSRSNLKQNIVMTFVKLKQNASYKSLAVFWKFGSPQMCETVFDRTLKALSDYLRPAIYWPTGKEISCNIPKSFRGFEGIRVLLDCIEIKIQRPKDLVRNFLTYSPQENDCTIKFVTGFTPTGEISFVSQPYSGRMSHKAAFESCNLIRWMGKRDFLIVDKRFVVKGFCHDKTTKFVGRINYVKGRKQTPDSYALVTPKDPAVLSLFGSFAGKDDHIKSKNQRINSFRILKRLPAKLVERSKDIVTVICATVNLSSPLLKDCVF